MYPVVLFGFIVHIQFCKLRIFSLYVDLKLIYFVLGDFDWIFVLAIVMRMTMGDKNGLPPPPDTLNRFIPSGGYALGGIEYLGTPAACLQSIVVKTMSSLVRFSAVCNTAIDILNAFRISSLQPIRQY